MSVSSQVALSNMTEKFGGRLPVRIYFLDNSSKIFLIDENATVSHLVSAILVKFEVRESELFVPYYGLFESLNGLTISSCRGMEEVVSSIIDQWGSNSSAKFVFMIRLFMPCIYGLDYEDELSRALKKKLTLREYLNATNVRDNSLLYFQYMQAVYGVITGQYPTTEETALKLACLHFQQKFGNYNSTSHKPGFLGGRIVEFIPIKLLKQKSLEQWEQLLFEAVEERATNFDADVSASPQRLYMNEIFPMVPYGCTLFKCKVNSTTSTSPYARQIPVDCVLGIHHLGVHIFEKGSSRKLLRSFRIEEMSRWSYKGSEYFNFEIQSSADISGIFEFQTSEGKLVSDLLTDYALAYVREQEIEESRAVAAGYVPSKQSVAAPAPSTSTTTEPQKDKEIRRKSATRNANGQVASAADAVVTTATNSTSVSSAPARRASNGKTMSATANAQMIPTSPPISAPKTVASTPPPPPPPTKPTPPAPLASRPTAPTGKEKRLSDAAVKIQSNFRGYNLRKDWAIEDAAILIQATYRGYRARIAVSAMIEEMLEGAEY